MNTLKNIVAILLIFIALISIFLGAYKPWKKSTMYITAQAYLPTFRTFDELTTTFDDMFNFYSPIGNREVSKFANSQFEVMVMNEEQSEVASLAIVQYAEQYLPQDRVVHLLQGANLYRILYSRFGRQEYLEKSEEYLKKSKEIAPKVPQALYEMFYLYEKSGQTEKMREIGQEILKYWPEDERVKNQIQT